MKKINKSKYSFYEYDKEYPKLFGKEKLRIKNVLPKGTIIEHVGSTSIPGLGGKGIIDIAIWTPKNKLKQFIKKLEKIGFNEVLNHPGDDRRIFMQKIKFESKKELRVHIHLCLSKEFWNSFIYFRDYLRKNDKERDTYARIKKEGVRHAKGKAQKYREFKDNFLNETTKKAIKRLG